MFQYNCDCILAFAAREQGFQVPLTEQHAETGHVSEYLILVLGRHESSGTVDDVKNAKGKKRMKLAPTAPGFAVFKAIA